MWNWLSGPFQRGVGLGSRASKMVTALVLSRAFKLAVLVLLVVGASYVVASRTTVQAGLTSKVYWTELNPGVINQANLNGSNIQALSITALGSPIDVAIDPVGDKLYWTEGDGDIRRANLDGSGAETLLTDTSDIRGIAVDPIGSKVYWTIVGTSNKIRRADLNGSNLEDLVTGLGAPSSVALDVGNGKMYWSEDNGGKIRRANLDGTSVEDRVTGIPSPAGIALDTGAGKVYWIENGVGAAKIRRANLDGSGQQDLITGIPDGAVYIALDPIGGKMYWTELGGLVRRADLAGTNAEVLYTATGNAFPWGIALHTDLVDTDGDGCADLRENLPKSEANQGGGRDYLDPWDYYDVLGPGAALPKDGVIDLPNDILGVILHFSPGGEPPYDANFDRGPTVGANHWQRSGPDGVIDLPNDILGVILQFGHNCV